MIRIAEFTEQYLGQVLDFGARHRLRWGGNEALFRWKFFSHPRSADGARNHFWLVLDGERVVGINGGLTCEYWIGGQCVAGISSVDWYLDDACRGKGTGRELLGVMEQLAPLKLPILSSEVAHRLQLGRGYSALPMTFTTLRVRRPLACAAWWLRRSRPARSSQPSRSFAPAVSILLASPRLRLLRENETAEVLRLMIDAQQRYYFCALHDPRFLIWKYRQPPQRCGETFVLEQNGRPCAVFALASQNRGGLDVLLLGDLHTVKDGGDSARIVRQLVARAANALGADAVTAFGMGPHTRAVQAGAAPCVRRLHRASVRWDGGTLDLKRADWYVSASYSDYL